MHKEIEKRNSRSYVIPHQSLKSQYKRQGARSHFNFINYRCPGLSKHLRACRQPLNTLLLLPGEKRKRNTKKEKTRLPLPLLLLHLQSCRVVAAQLFIARPAEQICIGTSSPGLSQLLFPGRDEGSILPHLGSTCTREERERERERGHVFAGARLFNRMNNETRRKGNSLFGKF